MNVGASAPIGPRKVGLYSRPALAGLVVLSFALAARAEVPHIEFTAPDCAPVQNNLLVKARITPETGWSSVRTYFKRNGRPEPYFLEMRSAGQGDYWVVLPKADEDTVAIDVQIAVKDGDGNETRSDTKVVPVVAGCPVALTQDQLAFARNLLIAETLPAQYGGGVLGFLCDGIVLRMNSRGDLRPEDCCCEAAMLLYVHNPEVLLPLVILGGTAGGYIVTHGGGGEVSPARP